MKFHRGLIAVILGLLLCGAGHSQSVPSIASTSSAPQASLVSVEITPGTAEIALGTTIQLAATAKYSDGSTRDVTNLATWTSSSGSVLSVNGEGLITAFKKGNTTISATFESRKGQAHFPSNPQIGTFILPSGATIAPRKTVQYQATAWFYDGQLQDVTNSVNWSVVETSIATVSNSFRSKGLVTGVSSGVATVSANSNFASAMVTVTNVTLFPATSVYATGSDGQVELNWTAASGASSYNIMRSATAGGPYTQIGTAGGTTYTDSGLTDGTSYYYVVVSVKGSTESSNSNEACGTPLTAGATSVIRHVVYIIKENRSFDNMFGAFPNANGATKGTLHTGKVIQLGHTPDSSPRDIVHDWNASLGAMDGGRMDRYDLIPGGNVNGDELSYTQFQQSDIPNTWTYAQSFVLADAMFSGMHANSFPAHVFFAAAQSPAITNPEANDVRTEWGCDAPTGTNVPVLSANGQLSTSFPCFNVTTMADVLNEAQDSWASYSAVSTDLGYVWAMFRPINQIFNSQYWQDNVFPNTQFVNDAANATLPTVTWLTPTLQTSEHPPESTCAGENWTVEQINAIMTGPNWSSTVIFLVWDDFGGWYDHVYPPQTSGEGLGIRVPLLIISPYAKQVPQCSTNCGTITHTQYQFGSIFRFIETVFGVQSLTNNDATANDMLDSFDFSQTPVQPLTLQTRTCP